MNGIVGAIPERNRSSNFMSPSAVSYDGNMAPRLATFKTQTHPHQQRLSRQ